MPGMPATPTPTRTPYPTGTRLPAFAAPMGTPQPTFAAPPGVGKQPISWLDPYAPGLGPQPPAPISFPGGGGGVGAGGIGQEITPLTYAPWEYAAMTPEQRLRYIELASGGGPPTAPTWYQQEQVRLADERAAYQRMQDLMGLAAGRQPSWLQREQMGLSREEFAWQQQQAQLAQQLAQQKFGLSQQQFAGQQEYQQQSLAQARMIALQQLAQAQRELAAAIGGQVAGIQAQTWAQGLPFELPRGTQFAPGMGPAGPASRLARMSGSQFTPMRIAPSPPPSPQELMTLVQQAASQFGPGG